MVEKSNNLGQMFTSICAFLIAFFIMFKYLLGGYYEFFLLGIVIIMMLRRTLKIKFDISDLFWVLYAIVRLSFGISRDSRFIVIRQFLLLMAWVFIKILLQSDSQSWRKKLSRFILLFGIIHSIGIVTEVIAPIFTKNIRNLLNIYSFIDMSHVYRSGFTNQPGVAGFCISCFSCVCAIYFFQAEKKQKMKYLLLLLLGIFSLLLTGKRALFAEVVFVFFLISFFYYSVIRKKGVKFFIALFAIIALLPIIVTQPVVSDNIERLVNGDDAGRLVIWRFLLSNFKSSPVIGVGRNVFVSQISIGTHNEYLGVLSENGLFGFVFFLPALLLPLFKVIGTIVQNRKQLKLLLLTDHRDLVFDLLISAFFQITILLYALTGNPLTSAEQAVTYFTFTAIGLGAIGRLRQTITFAAENSQTGIA